MAKYGQTGNGRVGAVTNRTQFLGPNGNWTKRDSETGRIMDQKTSSDTKFKGVTEEK